MIRPVLLFLDFDGVTHPMKLGEVPFHRKTMQRLEKVLKEHSEVSIVVSSTWRQAHTDEELGQMLIRHMPSLDEKRYLGTTKRDISDRFKAIQEFVGRYPTIPYIILDDAVASFPVGLSQLIAPKSSTGMADEDFVKLVALISEYRADPRHRFPGRFPGNTCVDCNYKDPLEIEFLNVLECDKLGSSCYRCKDKAERCTLNLTVEFEACVRTDVEGKHGPISMEMPEVLTDTTIDSSGEASREPAVSE